MFKNEEKTMNRNKNQAKKVKVDLRLFSPAKYSIADILDS